VVNKAGDTVIFERTPLDGGQLELSAA